MILIADSGSTKTTWCLYNRKDKSTEFLQTAGINPYYQNEQEILEMLKKEFTSGYARVESVYFYGAGCANISVNNIVKEALSGFFQLTAIEVESDLMAAARSLCGHQPGIVCILGTGSNSCYYNGITILRNVSPLGFILGDEGSGGVLGKKLLADVLKNQLPGEIVFRFFEQYKITQSEIMENIYRNPFPNRYAARYTMFILENIREPALRELVFNEFVLFFRRNVMQYSQARESAIHFTGSIAFYFGEILKEAARSLGLLPGKIVREPIAGLIEYHLNI
jgi:glucosamine kinase